MQHTVCVRKLNFPSKITAIEVKYHCFLNSTDYFVTHTVSTMDFAANYFFVFNNESLIHMQHIFENGHVIIMSSQNNGTE